MGGCRCTFRDCQNSSLNSPEMHFFHFPYKTRDRCRKWAQNAQKMEFLQLDVSKLRNKVVCEVHFTNNSFMNYRKERLIKTAVPTLYYVSDGEQIECGETVDTEEENVDEGEPKTNDLNIQIDLPEQEMLSNNTKIDDKILPNSFESSESLIDNAIEECQITDTDDPLGNTIELFSSNGNIFNMKVAQTVVTKTPKPKLLNYIASSSRQKLDMPCTFKAAKRPNVNVNLKYVVKKSKPHDHNKLINENVNFETNPSVDHSTFNIKDDVTLTDSPVNTTLGASPTNVAKTVKPSPPKSIENELNADILVKLEKIQAEESNKVDKTLYLQTMENQAKQIEELKKLVMEKVLNPADSISHSNASTPSSSSAASLESQHIRVEKGPAMTKIQLFNGIRKYLNPTMVALLRMEMFGGPEKQYRSDEKQLSKELYNLNQQVYDYMRDEWRFRLPAKSDVELWLKEQDDDEYLELC